MGANHGPAISIGKRSTVLYAPRYRAPRNPSAWSGKPFFNVPNAKIRFMAELPMPARRPSQMQRTIHEAEKVSPVLRCGVRSRGIVAEQLGKAVPTGEPGPVFTGRRLGRDLMTKLL